MSTCLNNDEHYRFVEIVKKRLSQTGILSLNTLNEIARDYDIKNPSEIIKSLLDKKELKIVKMLTCPNCYQDLGKFASFLEVQDIQCEYCGKIFQKDGVKPSIFFLVNYL